MTPAPSASTLPPSRSLRVVALTQGPAVPSARFRVRQYLQPLARLGVDVDERFPAAGAYPPPRRWTRPAWAATSLLQRIPGLLRSRSADVTLIQREFLSSYATLERFARRPVVADIDDAIHLLRGGRAATNLAQLARIVICGNSWLADAYRAYHRDVRVLPTPVDTDAIALAAHDAAEPPTLAWIGTSGNLAYLREVAPALATVMRERPRLRLAICCDRAPDELGIPPDRLSFTRWSPTAEARFFARFAIGLMPLSDGDWERGKCSFKMLQYLAAGWPCVASPVGMNAEVLAAGRVGFGPAGQDAWVQAMLALIDEPVTAAAMGLEGRRVVEERYSVTALAPRLAAVLRDAAT